MAERRMFHTAVVESDAFLDLPVGAQALYFHIGMHADDDGFVNGPRQVTRIVGTGMKNLTILVEKGFLLQFGDVVVLRHWLQANTLKKDRMKPVQYPEVARQLFVTKNGLYSLTSEDGGVCLLDSRNAILDSKKFHSGSKTEPKVREGKVKKDNIIEDNIKEVSGREEWNPAQPEHSPTQDTELLKMNGVLGKGVVLLSNQEQEELLDKLGLDGFDYYVEKLAKFILSNNASIRNHYATILKWWQEDRSVVHDQ